MITSQMHVAKLTLEHISLILEKSRNFDELFERLQELEGLLEDLLDC